MGSFIRSRVFQLWAILFCTILPFPLVYCFSQDSGPGEPEIVLPPVVLELEDLKVEELVVELPKEEITPYEIDIPLPEPEEVILEEPQNEPKLPQVGELPVSIKKEGRFFIAEGILGVGTLNHILSSISLYRYEKQPEGKILFSHEVVDGFSGKPAGSGFNMRDDRIAGSLGLRTRRLEIGFDGSFEDGERGLQGNGDFYSKLNRHTNVGGELNYRISERFSLKGKLETSTTTQLLTSSGTKGLEAEKDGEYLFSSSLEGRYDFRTGYFGISPCFNYRVGSTGDSLELSRFQIRGFFGVDLSSISTLEASAGWFWSSGGHSLIPFSFTLSANPSDLFSFRGSFGYRVIEYNLSNILPVYTLIEVPGALRDSSGWYGEMSSHLYLTHGLTVLMGVTFQNEDAMPTPLNSPVLTSGLFPFEQKEALRLKADAGLRWNISKTFTGYIGLKSELLDKPEFFPTNMLSMELSFMDDQGRYGGTVTSEMYTGVNDFVQAPQLDIQGFYRITESIRLGAQVDDLLYPLLDAPRYSVYPYVDMGLKLTFKTYITF